MVEYYKLSRKKFNKIEKELTDNEKSYYKKLLNKIRYRSLLNEGEGLNLPLFEISLKIVISGQFKK